MTIDRDGIRGFLLVNGSDKTIVDPAMQFLEPIFRAIEANYLSRRDPRTRVTNAALREAVGLAVSESDPICIRQVPATVSSTMGNLLRDERHGTPLYVPVYQVAYHGSSPALELQLSDFSPSLQGSIQNGITNDLMPTLSASYGIDISSEITRIVIENMWIMMRIFLNMTLRGRTQVIQQRLKRLMLILPCAMPLYSLKSNPNLWVCLAP